MAKARGLFQEKLNVLLRFVKRRSRKETLQKAVMVKFSLRLTSFFLLFHVNPFLGPSFIFLEILKIGHLFQLNGSFKYFLNTRLIPQGD